MSGMPTDLAMMDAWRARYEAAYKTLAHMRKAPALFKPEFVAEVEKDLRHARAQFDRWQGLS